MNIAYITNKGITREKNEDSLLINDQVFNCTNMDDVKNIKTENDYNQFFIADGLGGEKKGELASGMLLDSLSKKYFYKINELIEEIYHTKQKMDLYSINNSNIRFGTTLAGIVVNQKNIFILNIGDTRIYKISDMNIEQLSIDHTIAQQEVERGRLKKEKLRTHPIRNFLTSSVSGSPTISITSINSLNINIKERDIILILSDGVWELFEDYELFEILKSSNNLKQSVENLYKKSYVFSKDNLSIIGIEF